MAYQSGRFDHEKARRGPGRAELVKMAVESEGKATCRDCAQLRGPGVTQVLTFAVGGVTEGA